MFCNMLKVDFIKSHNHLSEITFSLEQEFCLVEHIRFQFLNALAVKFLSCE